MKSFNNTMAEDNYNTSQSNLNAADQQQQQQPPPQPQLRRQRSQQSSEQLAGGAPRTTRIADEMSQDLQYLSREAPLDGGESTFGAYSTLGGSQQQHPGNGSTTVTRQSTYKSTVTRTSTTPLGDDDALQLDDDDDRQRARDMQNDYERTDFRIDGDDDATQVYEYNQQMRPGSYASTGGHDTQSPFGDPQEHQQQLEQLAPDNVDIQRPLQQAGFLVSFMVDARGGAMRGCRHSGVRVIIPPGTAPQPMRITCRYLRRERLVHPPPLMEGEACASKILEVGPAGARFLGSVLIEVPHFASLRGKEREIIILRSDSGEVWREHLFDTDEHLIDSIIKSAELVEQQHPGDQENQRPSSAIGQTSQKDGFGGGGGGESNLQQQERRLTRIVTNEFPQYFAIISRIRQEVHTVGPEGLAVDSQVVPRVQAIFTDGALTKRIKIGLQAQSVPNELVMKLFGSLTAISFSPIVTIEPRRRKFHRPIKLKIPLPAGYRLESSGNLRLLCSITGGQSKAVWEDVTGSTPLSIHEKCLLFTTTVSARFWLVHCQRSQRCQDAARFSQELWRYLVQVPFMAKFVVFAKRRDINEANVRVFCMTDDKEEKTLEVQEHYTLVARSRDVEVLDGQMLYLEFGGNLIPAHLNGAARRAWPAGYTSGGRPNSGLLVVNSSVLLNEQLAFMFRAFQENRLAFACRLREVGQEPTGRIAFMEDSLKYLASLNPQQRAYLSERRRRAVCTLGIQLPAMCVHYDNILGTPKRNSYYANARIGDLSLADIASELNLRPLPAAGGRFGGSQEEPLLDGGGTSSRPHIFVSGSDLSSASKRPDWMELAPKLGIPRDEVEFIAEHCAADSRTGAGVTPALLLLMHWYRLASPDDRDQDLARGLLAIGREDIAQKLNFPIEPKRISRSTAELLREIEMIPVRSTENLYGSEVSSYSAGRNQRATSSARAASSLRRLNDIYQQEQEEATRSDYEQQQQRRRAGSASSIQRRQQQSTDDGSRNNYFSSGLRNAGQSYEDDARVAPVEHRHSYSRTVEQTTLVEQSKRQRRRRG